MVALILAVAFGLRLAFILQLRQSPFFANPFSDSLVFLRIADDLLNGQAVQAWFMSPLYPYLLAAVKALTGDVLIWMRIVQAVAGTAAVALIHATGVRLYGRTAGRIAAGLAAICAPFIFHDAQILFDGLQVLLVSAAMWFFVRALAEQRLRDLVLAGFVCGLLAVNRATTLLLPALFLLLWFRAGKRSIAPVTVLASVIIPILLCILPFTLHNLSAEGVFIPITSSGGYNLHAGNNAEASGFYTVPERIDLYEDPNGRQYAERTLGRTLTSAEVSSFWSGRAWEWITANPARALVLAFVMKPLRFFAPQEIDQMGLDPGFVRQEWSTILDLPLAGFALVFVLAAFGAVAALRSRAPVAVPGIVVLALLLGSMVFFANARIRLVAIPPLLLLAGLAVDRIMLYVRGRRWRDIGFGALAAAAALAVMYLPQAPRATWDQEYVRLGQIAFSSGQTTQAEALFRKSIEQRATVQGLMNLGNALAVQGRTTQAERAYADALRLDPNQPLLHFNLGNFEFGRGNIDNAMGAWQRAVDLQPTLAPAWRNMGLVAMRAGHIPEAVRFLSKARDHEKDPAAAAAIERDLRTLREIPQAQRAEGRNEQRP